jgi:hypothetical protein
VRITLEDVAFRLLPRIATGKALAHREWLTLVSVAEVLLQGAPHEITPEKTADNIERFLMAGRSRRAWRVRLLTYVIELTPLPSHHHMFSSLSRDRRQEIIETRWIAGRHLWRVCAKVRDLVILGAYSDTMAEARTGYVPVPLRPRFKQARSAAQVSTSEVA